MSKRGAHKEMRWKEWWCIGKRLKNRMPNRTTSVMQSWGMTQGDGVVVLATGWAYSGEM